MREEDNIHMQFRRLLPAFLLITCLISCRSAAPEPATPATRNATYLSLLRHQLVLTRSQLPQITASAELVADRVISGGRLYATGSQPDFTPELVTRAGGLMGIKPLGSNPVRRGDVILVGTRGQITDPELRQAEQWQTVGAFVVFFDQRAPAPCSTSHCLISNGGTSGLSTGSKICPTDTVLNVANAWTWTAEFVAACTRRGRMPTLYYSYLLPGGRERGQRYEGRFFHDDLKISPIAAGRLGRQYLDFLDRMLAQLQQDGSQKIQQAASWLKETDPKTAMLMATGHLFPHHYADPRAPQPFGTTTRNDTPPGAGQQFVLALGYQQPPRAIVDGAKAGKYRLLYTSVQADPGPSGDNILYVNPHWPLEDGGVRVPGYDIPILPASGVGHAALYWSLLAGAAR